MTAATPDEVWKARAEFQREIYRVADARVASFDTQLGVIIAAAVALVGFGAGAATSREVTSSSLITAVAAAAVTALLALCARQELPWLVASRACSDEEGSVGGRDGRGCYSRRRAAHSCR